MIGNYADAQAALNGDLDFLGDGSTRNVYLKDGIVYKVDTYCGGANKWEWRKYLELSSRTLPDHIGIAKTHFFEDLCVIAMELIEGQALSRCWCDDYGERHTFTCFPDKSIVSDLERFISDLGGENVIFDGERYWIIDMGE